MQTSCNSCAFALRLLCICKADARRLLDTSKFFCNSSSMRLCVHPSEKNAAIVDFDFRHSFGVMQAIRAKGASAAGSEPVCQ